MCEDNVDEEPFNVPDPLSSRWEKPDKREAVVLFTVEADVITELTICFVIDSNQVLDT